MKRALLTAVMGIAALAAKSQVVTDTVSVGATTPANITYPDQVWYSLSNDEQGRSEKTNWDIAFDASGFGSGVLINSVTGTTLYKYPKADTSGWNSIDTVGMSGWMKRYNSDTSWALPAIGRYADPTNQLDLDWGKYNMTTHVVTGDSIFIVKLANGAYKKLWIVNLNGGAYEFKYANLDGSSAHDVTFTKSLYNGKNYGYYSLQNDAALDREPLSANWDLLFTQHTAFIPQAYTVTGVLHNAGVSVAKCENVPNKETFTNYSAQTFNTAINEIGYNWKTFTGTAYTVQDSLVYFVKQKTGDIWKVIFRGFGGASNGNYIFTKEKIFTAPTGVETVVANKSSLVLYPNPSNGQNVTVLYGLSKSSTAVKLSVVDISGRTVLAEVLNAQPGLHQYALPAMRTGMYIVTVEADGQRMQQKMIVQ